MIRFEQRNAAPATNQSHFATVPRAEIERSKFDRSHTRKQTMNSDLLYPIYYDEVLPGDTFNMRLFSLARLVAPIKPLMDNLYADVFFFYVPNRLLSSKWEGIMGQQPDPDTDVSSYALTPLRFTSTSIAAKSLHDYLGFNVKASGFTKDVSPLYHLAYNFIWNEFFRDENLQDPVYFDAAEPTAYSPANFTLLARGKRHDYFTSALPWPQKGPDVELPVGGQADLVGTPAIDFSPDTTTFYATTAQSTGGAAYGTLQSGGSTSTVTLSSGPTGADTDFRIPLTVTWPTTGITFGPGTYADLSTAAGVTINAFREAFQVQRLYERDARGGTRYIESLLSHFGVVSPDFRLQRPEYLGGGSSKVTISPIPQTSQTATTPLGTLGATGYFSHSGTGFVKSFVEHGVILGLMAVRADLTYQQGLHRSYNRFSRLDFAYPVLAHLGEQAILNQEIFMQGDAVVSGPNIVDYEPFGYQERYAEYRYKPSEICGEFRSDYAQSLDVWHVAQDFANLPVLNEEFIKSNTPMARVLSVTTQDQFEVDMSFKLICGRPLPMYGVPGFVDHF